MNYAGIKYCDIANGTGCRTVLFVSGCRNACKGCFQPQTWDFGYGEPFDEKVQEEVLKSLEPDYITGITVLGGEPFEPENQRALLPFVRRVRETLPQKTIWAYSGFTYDGELLREGSHPRCEVTDELLSLLDVLVDGRFVLAQKDISLRFRGSRNQRILDLRRTREAGHIVLWTEPKRGI